MHDKGNAAISSHREIAECVQYLFPDVQKKKRRNSDKTVSTIYHGIKIKPLESLKRNGDKSIDISELAGFVPEPFIVYKVEKEYLVCKMDTEYSTQGNTICKEVSFKRDYTFSVSIGDKTVDLKSVGISNQFTDTKQNIQDICNTISKIKLCHGVKVTKSVVCSRFHTLDNMKNRVSGEIERVIRSVTCLWVTKFNAVTSVCLICQRMTFNEQTPESTCNKENLIKEMTVEHGAKPVSKEDIQKLIPNAPEQMIDLLLSQVNNSNKHVNGRRWSKEIIGSCLQIYSRNPHVYKLIRDSHLLVLPSPNLLISYKNRVKHDIGFSDEIFRWMLSEARRLDLPQHGYVGGVVIDEMKLQPDLQITKNGDVIDLVGFEDVGEEGNMCTILRKGHNEKELGSYALQFMFLSITGFRFPFAHFVSNNVQAYDLHNLFWEAVGWLKKYSFTVAYVCLDGAQSNRTFMHINVGKKASTFISANPTPYDPSVVFLMDPSHVFKKIRNNTLRSGAGKGYTRNLCLPDDHLIQWKMWENAFTWDRSNALQLHKKLSADHFHLNSQSKMRNHLAEEVLNSDMLHLMCEYQKTLTNKTVLDGAVQFLEKTSSMIQIFKDRRPISSRNDDRLNKLLQISGWFTKWEESAMNKLDENNRLMSGQCIEDIRSCLVGFVELCRLLLLKKEVEVIPAMINSDVIENMFCQQRASYNGANTNPNALQYRNNINSIILGQTLVSRKANAGKSVIKAPKLMFSKQKSILPNYSSIPDSTVKTHKPLKVIRM